MKLFYAAVLSGSFLVAMSGALSATSSSQDFSHYIPLCQSDQTPGIALGDVNGDGRLDGTLTGHPNHLYLNDGNGRFPRAVAFGSPKDASEGIAVSDLDRDGYLDVVVGNTGQQNKIFFGDGKGKFPRSSSFGHEAAPTRAVAVGDIDGHVRVARPSYVHLSPARGAESDVLERRPRSSALRADLWRARNPYSRHCPRRLGW